MLGRKGNGKKECTKERRKQDARHFGGKSPLLLAWGLVACGVFGVKMQLLAAVNMAKRISPHGNYFLVELLLVE